MVAQHVGTTMLTAMLGAASVDRARLRIAKWLSRPSALAALFIVGFILRVLFMSTPGMQDDMQTLQGWVERLVQMGPSGFYPREGDDFFIDYPPGLLFVFWVIGRIAVAVDRLPLPMTWLKAPAVCGDLALAWVVGRAAQRVAGPDRHARTARVAGAAAVLLNPAFVFLSAVWGQFDSIPAAFVVGALLLMCTGERSWSRDALGMAVLALGAGTKPQALFVAPIVAVVLIRRYLIGPTHGPTGPRVRWAGVPAFVALGVVAATTLAAMFVPFGLSPVDGFRFYQEAASKYPFTGLFAFNLWGAVHFWRPGNLFFMPDSGRGAYRILGSPAVAVGAFAFAVIGSYVCYRTWAALRRGIDEARAAYFGAVAISLVAFAVLTRVHERYLFLALALGAVFVTDRVPRAVFAAGSILYLGMLWFPFVFWQRIAGLPAKELGPLYGFLFGREPDAIRLRVYAFVTGAASLAIAIGGWRAIVRRSPTTAAPPASP